MTNEDIAATITGFIRQAALGDPLVPYNGRVERAINKVFDGKLDMILGEINETLWQEAG